MFQNLLESVFGCSHARTTFPLSPSRKTGAVNTGPYVACLDCGKEFAYDWTRMRLGHPVTAASGVPTAAPLVRTV
jgi:hypothetical protein